MTYLKRVNMSYFESTLESVVAAFGQSNELILPLSCSFFIAATVSSISLPTGSVVTQSEDFVKQNSRFGVDSMLVVKIW